MSGSDDITHLAWIDLETCGLDKYRDPIIEFAMIVTDLNLEPPTSDYQPFVTAVNPGFGLLDARLDQSEWAADMHQSNGLLDQIKRGDCITTDECERQAISHLATYCKPKLVAIAGSGVANFDKPVIDLQMKGLSTWFPYFTVDVGHLRRFIKHVVGQEIDMGPAPEDHRAFSDIRYALYQAHEFRKLIRFVTHPEEEYS